MSHTTKATIDFSDLDALRIACEELGHAFRDVGTVRLYAESVADAYSVKLKHWNYPIAIKNGEVFFDNYNGRWGDIKDLNALKARYGIVQAERRARARGQSTERVRLDNGTVQVRIAIR
jgi:hypothetical protein